MHKKWTFERQLLSGFILSIVLVFMTTLNTFYATTVAEDVVVKTVDLSHRRNSLRETLYALVHYEIAQRDLFNVRDPPSINFIDQEVTLALRKALHNSLQGYARGGDDESRFGLLRKLVEQRIALAKEVNAPLKDTSEPLAIPAHSQAEMDRLFASCLSSIAAIDRIDGSGSEHMNRLASQRLRDAKDYLFAGNNLALLMLILAVISVRDEIKQRIRAEALLKQAYARKDEYLAMLAHELRNPLAPILNAIEVIRKQPATGNTVGAMTQVLSRHVQHLRCLVDELLDVARVTHGYIRLHKQLVHAKEIIDHAIQLNQSLLDRKQLNLTLDIEQDLRFQADPTRLIQIVANLLNNAGQYTPFRGHIWIVVHRLEHAVEFGVRDDGVGIKKQLIPHLFELFVQAEQSSDRPQGGLGVGLALTKRLVALHGGNVHVYSAGENKGSEFKFTLPID